MNRKILCFLINGKELLERKDSLPELLSSFEILEVSKIIETAPGHFVLDSRIFVPPTLEIAKICPISEYFFFNTVLFYDNHIAEIFKNRKSDFHQFRISKKEAAHLKVINDMIKTYQNDDEEESKELLISNLLKNNVLHLKKVFEKSKDLGRNGPVSDNVPITYLNTAEAFKGLVALNAVKEKGVTFYAESLNITNRTLSNITRKVMDRSPKEIIDSYLIELGQKMLEDTGLSIKEVSYSLGFRSANGFSMYFKKLYGKSPTEYREFLGQGL